MQETRDFLVKLGLPGKEANDLPDLLVRFPDGAQYRVEIPSVEGPRALEAVLEEAARYSLYIHRVSQGSGVLLLTDGEIEEMVRLCAGQGMELSLFVGPRASWDIGSQVGTLAGKGIAGKLRGVDQLVYAIEDAKRACVLGVRGLLVADEGLLWVLDEMKKAGESPTELVLKISVQMVAANPGSPENNGTFGRRNLQYPDRPDPASDCLAAAGRQIFLLIFTSKHRTTSAGSCVITKSPNWSG